MGAAPYLLGLLSGEGYQVFATLPGEYRTEDEAIHAAKADYLARLGGTPTFRVYHVAPTSPGPRLTLIEVSFDASKQRSFVALYKVFEAPCPPATQAEPPRSIRPSVPLRERVAALLARFFPGPSAHAVAFDHRGMLG